MPKPEDFARYYKNIPDSELLEILQKPENYQPEAVDAARIEFQRRGLSEEQVEAALEILDIAAEERESRSQKIKIIESRATNIVATINESFIPSTRGIPSPQRTIQIISLVYLISFISHLIFIFSYFSTYFRAPGIGEVLYVEELLVLALAIFFFWQKVRIGWILLFFYATYSAITQLWFAYQLIRMQSRFGTGIRLTKHPIGIEIILTEWVLVAGTIWIISRPAIREIYGIDKRKMQYTIIGSTVLTFLLLLFFS